VFAYGNEEVLPLPRDEAGRRVRLAAEEPRPAGLLLPTVRSAYGKEHYAANRQRYIDQAAAQKRKALLKRTMYLIEFFKTHPCSDCGEQDPVVLEFDHLRDKSFNISQKFRERAWQTILDEMEKCEVVCANCHRRRTAKRQGALRAVLTQD
jgi:5-methylcytosine-specific restriction endonuclease McrA